MNPASSRLLTGSSDGFKLSVFRQGRLGNLADAVNAWIDLAESVPHLAGRARKTQSPKHGGAMSGSGNTSALGSTERMRPDCRGKQVAFVTAAAGLPDTAALRSSMVGGVRPRVYRSELNLRRDPG